MADQITILAWVQTFAAILALIGVAIGVYTLRQSLNQAIVEDIRRICFDKRYMWDLAMEPPHLFCWLTGKRVEVPKLPTIESFIKAGEHLVYTSAMFDQAPASSMEVCWVILYTQFFKQKPPQLDSRERIAGNILSRASTKLREIKDGPARVTKARRATIQSPPQDEEGLRPTEEDMECPPSKEEDMYANKNMVYCVRDLDRCEEKGSARDTRAQWFPP